MNDPERAPTVPFGCTLALLMVHAIIGLGSPEAKASNAVPDSTACDISAWVNETDSRGLNVRKAPHLGASVLGRLPPVFLTQDEYRFPVRVVVDVLRSSGGWLQVSNARDNDTLTGRPPRPAFGGTGWVSGRKITLKSQASKGHARPDLKSDVVLRTSDGSTLDGDDVVSSAHVVACSGKWAWVEFDMALMPVGLVDRLEVAPLARASLPKGRFRAWLNQICGIQETSCSGLGGEEAEPPAPR